LPTVAREGSSNTGHFRNLTLGILALGLCAVATAQAANPFFDTTHFSGSGNCALCHNGLVDAAGNDVSIETSWSATIMGNAARDPLWKAKFATEILRNPQHDAVLNDKCTRCHAPMANQQSVFDGIAPQYFGVGGFEDPDNIPIHDAAMDGVSCTLCHQIADVPELGTDAGESGHYVIQDLLGFDRPAYGPYTNPRINPMQMNSVFTPQYSAHVSDSTLCGTCHNLKTPILNPAGELTADKFPEQMVYSEWENSDFADGGAEASSCQQCHMARAEGPVKISNRPRMLGTRDNFAIHGFYGGNTLILDILDKNRAELDVGNGDFLAAIDATRATLQSAAGVAIEETFVDEPAPGQRELVVRVRVDNNSGHKVPTSYPSRRAYIHLAAADQDGFLLFESGRLATDANGKPTGAVIGVDADTDAGPAFEPHHEEITSPDQVQVYEAIMEDISGNQTYTLLNAARYSKDNRLLPRGFPRDPRIDPVVGNWNDIAIVGEAELDPDFVAGSDLVTYRIPLDAATSSVTVSADLNYQTMAYGYYLDLIQAVAQVPEVADFQRLYEASDVRVEIMASASAVVETGAPVDQPPVASFTVACTDLTCDFDAGGSTDDGTIVSYAWTFGDGGTATGVTASHGYAADGIYTVTLTVTDDQGATDSIAQQVSVSAGNQSPSASFTFLCTDLVCSFDGSGSTDDGTIVSYAWAFGDGGTATGMTANHTYALGGTYNVTLTVTDDAGATGTMTQAVTVTAPENQAPTASFTINCTNLTCSFDGSGSKDDGTIVSYAWTFGDGGTATGVTANHTYAAGGTYTVTLTVRDDGGLTGADSQPVTVTAAIPGPGPGPRWR
jgi:PKD repeat protein